MSWMKTIERRRYRVRIEKKKPAPTWSGPLHFVVLGWVHEDVATHMSAYDLKRTLIGVTCKALRVRPETGFVEHFHPTYVTQRPKKSTRRVGDLKPIPTSWSVVLAMLR